MSMSMETLHISYNKLSAVCAVVQAAELRGCFPHGGSVRAVCNEPCHWSCSRKPFPRMRDKAAGVAFLSEKVHVQNARNWPRQQNLPSCSNSCFL